VLGVILEVKPTFVPSAVGAQQQEGDVHVAPALLHLEVGATDGRWKGAILQEGEHEEILEEVPMGTHPQVPLAQCLERLHLLDVVWLEVLELQPVLEKHDPDEPPGGDREAALVKCHK
jgi:hypothetical protein